MSEAATLDPTRLVIAAIIGLALLLVLIIKFKVHAMISILLGAITIGVVAGMPLTEIVTAVNDGISNTLKGIALLVGLGSMFGAILEASGGAQTLAVTMVKKFGDEKAAWALGVTGLIIAMPVFFDAGLIILIPLAFSLAKRTKRSTLFYAIPLLAGLAVGHAFIPPTPGPVLVATMLNVDLGWVILVGIACGTVAMIIAGPVWGSICGKKYMVPVPEHVASQEDIDESKLPKFSTIVLIIAIPLVLIIFKSLAGVIPAMAPVAPVFTFLGEPFVALLIATIVAMLVLGKRHGYSMEELEKIMTKSLEPTGLILLVTACGGVLRYVLQYSGLGDLIGNAVASANLPIVLVAFIVAALVRICVGSATVAMTMAAGIIAAMPGISELPPLYLACVVAAVAGGSTVCSHFNDSGFWLVRSLVGVDEKTNLKTWTIMETKKYGTIVSYDLNYRPSMWSAIGGQAKAQEVNKEIAKYVDVMIGNEEDFTACLGFEIEGNDANLKELNLDGYKKMINEAAKAYPNFKAVATTLRTVKTATVNDWSAICWADGEVYKAKDYNGLEIMDRVGGGDSFASGLIYGLMTTEDAETAVNYGAAHGALAMTTPGDTTMVSVNEVEAIMGGAGARVQR